MDVQKLYEDLESKYKKLIKKEKKKLNDKEIQIIDNFEKMPHIL